MEICLLTMQAATLSIEVWIGKTLHCPKDNLIGKARHCGLVWERCRLDPLWPGFPTGKGIYSNITRIVLDASDRRMLKGFIVRCRHIEVEEERSFLCFRPHYAWSQKAKQNEEVQKRSLQESMTSSVSTHVVNAYPVLVVVQLLQIVDFVCLSVCLFCQFFFLMRKKYTQQCS